MKNGNLQFTGLTEVRADGRRLLIDRVQIYIGEDMKMSMNLSVHIPETGEQCLLLASKDLNNL